MYHLVYATVGCSALYLRQFYVLGLFLCGLFLYGQLTSKKQWSSTLAQLMVITSLRLGYGPTFPFHLCYVNVFILYRTYSLMSTSNAKFLRNVMRVLPEICWRGSCQRNNFSYFAWLEMSDLGFETWPHARKASTLPTTLRRFPTKPMPMMKFMENGTLGLSSIQ